MNQRRCWHGVCNHGLRTARREASATQLFMCYGMSSTQVIREAVSRCSLVQLLDNQTAQGASNSGSSTEVGGSSHAGTSSSTLHGHPGSSCNAESIAFFDPLRLTLLVDRIAAVPAAAADGSSNSVRRCSGSSGFAVSEWLEARHGVVPELATAKVRLAGQDPIMPACRPAGSPDINRPFWPFPIHPSCGLMSEARLCWPGFGAGFVEKPPNHHVPRQTTAATRPFLSGARLHPEKTIRPLPACLTVRCVAAGVLQTVVLALGPGSTLAHARQAVAAILVRGSVGRDGRCTDCQSQAVIRRGPPWPWRCSSRGQE